VARTEWDTMWRSFACSIVLDGKPNRFLMNFPRITALLAPYGREKVVRSLLGLVGHFQTQWFDRTSLLRLYCANRNSLRTSTSRVLTASYH
jgi:hypothetical protein